MDKDKSIVIQVAAKIAAELTPKDTTNMDTMLGNYAVLFDGIKGILVDEIFGQQTAGAMPGDDGVLQIINAFNATPVTASTVGISVKGKQHGELPGWLISACMEAGVYEVYDNRDSLAENPKRPWFKSVKDKNVAFWPPKGR
jgi:hypothetical protein